MMKNLKNKTKTLLAMGIAFGATGSLTAQDTIFDYTGSIQTYTVPDSVYTIQIQAVGAGGGLGSAPISGIAGKGAQMAGTFEVTPGQVLSILVGEQGQSAEYVGGGGGGTYIWDDATSDFYLVAGGGGGGGATDGADGAEDGVDASLSENGTNGNGFSDGGGTAGEGGTTPTALYYAGGGAGISSGGSDGTVHTCAQNCTGGTSLGTGGLGGGTIDYSAANGGFGGGGGGNARCGAVGGGGGGGYSGGGAGGEIVSGEYNGGGGGGSFNTGTDQENIAGIGTENGQVTINPICGNPIEVNHSTTDETTPASGEITLTVTGGHGLYSFDWSNDGTGDFDDSQDLIGLVGGTYIVEVVDESICINAIDTAIVNSQVGINENILLVGVYPNPTTDIFTISRSGAFTYNVFDLNGKLMANGSGIETQSVSLEGMSNGSYLVAVKANNKIETVAIVKQ